MHWEAGDYFNGSVNAQLLRWELWALFYNWQFKGGYLICSGQKRHLIFQGCCRRAINVFPSFHCNVHYKMPRCHPQNCCSLTPMVPLFKAILAPKTVVDDLHLFLSMLVVLFRYITNGLIWFQIKSLVEDFPVIGHVH